MRLDVLDGARRAEGLGLTLVEALLAGSAVVGTAAGGIPEVVRAGVEQLPWLFTATFGKGSAMTHVSRAAATLRLASFLLN